ncbi:hypothetical protein Ahy_B09g099632 [Arachis hypogaea]|uniref:Uncharacterized protein n=1 Tax=Arachis hypogaea TaxID=3818 RepID=A0A444XUA3_ARAHY|nr:hypothetical protein Ahy_B09g099632 [Arachis hypogaea]
MRVVAKAGCVRSLPRVAVVLVTGCEVGVAGIHHWCSRYLVPSSLVYAVDAGADIVGQVTNIVVTNDLSNVIVVLNGRFELYVAPFTNPERYRERVDCWLNITSLSKTKT